MSGEFRKLIARYGERYSTASIYIAFVLVSLVVAAVLFGVLHSTGVMRLAFAESGEPAEFGGAFAGFLATLVVLLRAYAGTTPAQSIVLKGNVIGADGRPLPGVTVSVDGVDRQKTTDAVGWFAIEVDDADAWVVRATSPTHAAETTVARADASRPVRLSPRPVPSVAAPRVEPAAPDVVWADLQPDYTEPFDLFGDGPEAALQVFGGNLQMGADGAWTGTLRDGCYVLANAAETDGVRYFYLGLAAEGRLLDLGERAVAVDVEVAQGGPGTSAGAGLLYRYDRSVNDYYAYVLQSDGSLTLRKRTAAGFATLFSGRPSSLKSGFNRLAIVGRGPVLHLYLNEERIKSVRDGALTSGDPGLVAIGVGTFRFDDFVLFKPPVP